MNNHNLFVLCHKIGQLCTLRDCRIAFAESCTGGMLASMITDVYGSSAWFNGSAVVYSNLAKENILKVDSDLIAKQGAVSEMVAEAMAKGAMTTLHADLAISITGVAGPGGGTLEKPVGMVCFGLASREGSETKTMYFTGGRRHIRQSACLFALDWLVMHLSVQ